MPTAVSFDEVLTQAVNYFVNNGYNDASQLIYWGNRLGTAARNELMDITRVKARLQAALTMEYSKLVDRGGAMSLHPDLSKQTLQRLRPILREILSNRVRAGNALATMAREEEIANTIRRFAGWASSLPNSSQPATDRRAVRQQIRSGLRTASRRETNLIIDQGHKLNSNLNAAIAENSGAIAAVWVSHYNQHNYDYREQHREFYLESQERPFLIRDSWAHKQGLLNTVGATFTDQLPHRPGQLPFCRCYFKYIYSPSRLPPEMLARAA